MRKIEALTAGVFREGERGRVPPGVPERAVSVRSVFAPVTAERQDAIRVNAFSLSLIDASQQLVRFGSVAAHVR